MIRTLPNRGISSLQTFSLRPLAGLLSISFAQLRFQSHSDLKVDSNEIKANSLTMIAKIHDDQNESDLAISSYQEAIKVQEAIRGTEATQAVLHNNLGNHQLKNEAFSEAIFSFKKAIELEGEDAKSENLATYKSNQRNAHLKFSIESEEKDLSEAIQQMESVFQLCEEGDASLEQYNERLGNLYEKNGDHEKAKECFSKLSTGGSSLSRLANNKGTDLFKEKTFAEAIIQFQAAINSQGDDKKEDATFQNNLANAYYEFAMELKKSDPKKAIEPLKASLEIHVNLGNENQLEICRNTLGHIYYDQGDKDKAMEYFKSAAKDA